MTKSIEFKPFKEIVQETGWRYRKKPIGQQWYYDANIGYLTNGRGEGMSLHKGTKLHEIYKIVDALNKRDVKIAELEKVN